MSLEPLDSEYSYKEMREALINGDIQRILNHDRFMENMGIPLMERMRVIRSMMMTPDPQGSEANPVTGIDLAGNQPRYKVPDTGSPPYFQPNALDLGWIPSVGFKGYMTQPTPDPLGSVKTNEPSYDLNGSNLGHTYNIVNPPAEPSSNWLGLSTSTPAEPSMHGEYGFNSDKAIPEWRYPVEDSQINIPPFSIAIPPSGVQELEPQLARYEFHGFKCDICKPFNQKVFDLNDTVHRPILPSEGLGWTTTHPNCTCTWRKLARTLKKVSTMNKSQQAQSTKIKKSITHKAHQGKLHTVFEDGKLSNRTRKSNPMKEAIAEVRSQFGWMSDDYLLHAKDLANSNGGQLYLINAAEESITDHRAEGEPLRRKLSGEELSMMARTAINKGMDVNHDVRFTTQATVLDSEFNPQTRQIQMIVMESDPEIIQAITNNQITAVSINGGSPRSETVEPCLNGCTDTTCELCTVPRGVVLGELDDIAMTWVATSPMMYRGLAVPSAVPGIKVTAIQPI